ncbi:protein of unknown function [Tepidanaerobacter acetatoxydans Re1]|uniref:Uncharacterized protein n=1 Tax=Tepidanaerobacter acetatoxydans (strain DSM 21804 / JCM 16047 / Re1) TaxID=1209989 RepID=L0RZJ9_TEPAE|nr:protein of unknown function [Tepidanaerobacter acetatoxydans Re1]
MRDYIDFLRFKLQLAGGKVEYIKTKNMKAGLGGKGLNTCVSELYKALKVKSTSVILHY